MSGAAHVPLASPYDANATDTMLPVPGGQRSEQGVSPSSARQHTRLPDADAVHLLIDHSLVGARVGCDDGCCVGTNNDDGWDDGRDEGSDVGPTEHTAASDSCLLVPGHGSPKMALEALTLQ